MRKPEGTASFFAVFCILVMAYRPDLPPEIVISMWHSLNDENKEHIETMISSAIGIFERESK